MSLLLWLSLPIDVAAVADEQVDEDGGPEQQ